jgi:hypothetical protein
VRFSDESNRARLSFHEKCWHHDCECNHVNSCLFGKGGLLIHKSAQGLYRKPTQIKEVVMADKRGSGKRELIDTKTDKRYVRRDDEGKFTESDDQGRSLAQDVKHEAKTKVKPVYGDRGDQKRS